MAAFLCATLGAVLVFEWRALGTPRLADAEERSSIEDDLPTASVPQYSVPNEKNFINAVERMLFSPGRRPVEQRADASPVASADDVEAENLELVAVLLEGERKSALLQDRRQRRESSWVEQGGTFRGWTVAEIDRDGVRVTRGDVRTDVYLRPFRQAAEQEHPSADAEG